MYKIYTNWGITTNMKTINLAILYIWVTWRGFYQKQELLWVTWRFLIAHLFSFLCLFVLFFFDLCLVCPMLPLSLDDPFLIAPSVFSNTYLLQSVLWNVYLMLTVSLIVHSFSPALSVFSCVYLALLLFPPFFFISILWIFFSYRKCVLNMCIFY